MAEPRRLDRVRIALHDGSAAISWAERERLLLRLRRVDGRQIVDAFEAVGATRPVELTVEQRAQLHGELVTWQKEPRAEVPAGLLELDRLLAADLRHAAGG